MRGRLSTTMAGNLGRLLGEKDIEQWVALAGLEAEPESYAKSRVLRLAERAEHSAEAVRFELTGPCRPTVFKTVAIDHSATLPGSRPRL